MKNLQNISSLHDLRTYTGAVKKSGKPALPTTAILDLYMRRSERNRLTGELERLRRRRQQLRRRLKDVEKEMNKLLVRATQTAQDLRGEVVKGKKSVPQGKKRLILSY